MKRVYVMNTKERISELGKDDFPLKMIVTRNMRGGFSSWKKGEKVMARKSAILPDTYTICKIRSPRTITPFIALTNTMVGVIKFHLKKI